MRNDASSDLLEALQCREPGAASLARIERKHPYKVVIEAVLGLLPGGRMHVFCFVSSLRIESHFLVN
jgi:hypothetical protein